MATLHILYGSATGNAEHIAKNLTKDIKSSPKNKFESVVCYEGDQFKKKCQATWDKDPTTTTVKKHGLIVVTSTTGNADAPENISRFMRFLKRKTTPVTTFQHVAFSVLGLGDTNYDQFCATAKAVDKRIGELGGTRVMPLACADEATGLEDVVDPWTNQILGEIQASCFSSDVGKESEPSAAKTERSQVPQQQQQQQTPPKTPGIPALAAQRLAAGAKEAAAMPGSRPNIVRNGIPPAAALKMAAATQSNPIQLPGSRPTIPARPGIPVAAANRMNASRQTMQTSPKASGESSNFGEENNNVKSASPLFILYGSATGNAEQIAKNLESKYNQRSNNFFPKVVCCEADKFKKLCQSTWESDPSPQQQKKHGLIIVSSTTGNGDAPENASRFMRFLKRKTTPVTSFQHVAFAVLGLGDTNYDQFCATAKTIDKRLAELGGVRAKALGCADEATGLEDVVDPWVQSVFDDIERSCRMQTAVPFETGASTVSNESEEEKKVECDEVPFNYEEVTPSVQVKPALMDSTSSSSMGVDIIRKILELSPGAAIPSVENKTLPSIGASLSSCQLVDDAEHPENHRRESRGMSLTEFDRMTISTTSSSGIHYTAAAPYESTIVGARYLTNTDTAGAKMACDALQHVAAVDNKTQDEKMSEALQIFQNSFPLSPPENSKEEDLKKYECNGKRVIELELSLPEDFTLEYQPGDSIGLLVDNSHEDTKYILDLLKKNCNIEPGQLISVNGTTKHITVETAMRENVDLSSPIMTKRIPLFLAHLAGDDTDEQKALLLLSSKTSEGEAIYKMFVGDQRKSFVDLVKDFPSCAANLTLENILSVLPGIAPRYYSISSSPLAKKSHNVLSLTVSFSVVDYLTANIKTLKSAEVLGVSRRKGGLATRYLEALCSPHLSGRTSTDSNATKYTVKIFPKPTSEFYLPKSIFTPLILIGPGTGVAPFMGFLSHRRAEVAAMNSTHAAKVASEGTWRGGYDIEEDDLQITTKDAKGLVIGADYRGSKEKSQIDLFFGCRYETHDWLYKEEMLQLKEEGIITNLNTAFSRDTGKRTYVQDLMRNPDCSKHLVKMIVENNASVYVCGDGNAMGKDVQGAITEILAKHHFGSDNEEEASNKSQAYFSNMKAKGRFLMDIWS